MARVHMNGRVYDPFLARMISADPTVPGPFNGQAFNRYSYVLNSPLSLTDPSGFLPLAISSNHPLALTVTGVTRIVVGGISVVGGGVAIGTGLAAGFTPATTPQGNLARTASPFVVSSGAVVTVAGAANVSQGFADIASAISGSPSPEIYDSVMSALLGENHEVITFLADLATLVSPESLGVIPDMITNTETVVDGVQLVTTDNSSSLDSVTSAAPVVPAPADPSSGSTGGGGGGTGRTSTRSGGSAIGSSVIIPGRWSTTFCGPGTAYACTSGGIPVPGT